MTAPDTPAKPIEASANTMHGAVPQALRYAATMFAAMALDHYFMESNVTAAGVALVGCVLPWAWGLVDRVIHNRRTKRLVALLPDELARFK